MKNEEEKKNDKSIERVYRWSRSKGSEEVEWGECKEEELTKQIEVLIMYMAGAKERRVIIKRIQ